MNDLPLGPPQRKSSAQIDRIQESELHASIFRTHGEPRGQIDFKRIREVLKSDSQIPASVADKVLRHMEDHIGDLGLDRPDARLLRNWLNALLREQGYSLGEASLQSLELSLNNVEMNIYHPIGFGATANQNPEASSQRIAQNVKREFAVKRVFQEDLIQAHESGRLDLLHLGAIDRPHDVFLTPDYLKPKGLPVTAGAPSAGPARRAHVMLAHLVRFTHELQNHFAGDIQWGYANTLLLPFLEGMSDNDLYQFVQQMVFEFSQLDTERGGLARRVVLDFDVDMPRQLAGTRVLLPGGVLDTRTYGELVPLLQRFNEAAVDVLRQGDARGNPFHTPRIVFHINDPQTTWSGLLQGVVDVCYRFGNPALAFSYPTRDFGALGIKRLNDADFMKLLLEPGQLRGFSSSSIAVNLPRLILANGIQGFEAQLDELMEMVFSAHRQKRLFISRLMSYGKRGPLQFLRHRIDDRPFLKMDQATQAMHLIGLGEISALLNGSAQSSPKALANRAEMILAKIGALLERSNQKHKLHMLMGGTQHESVAYRFAFLDLREFGNEYSEYLLREPDQSQPIYTEGTNILAFHRLSWRERIRLESGPLAHMMRSAPCTLFLKSEPAGEGLLYQNLFNEVRAAKHIRQLQFAPDLQICLTCSRIFHGAPPRCPSCEGTILAPYGLCQAGFSPVHTWCLGKRSEWKLRYRIDGERLPAQPKLPW